MMRCIVVDDEELQVSLCRKIIKEHTNLKHVGTYRNALDALKFIRWNPNIRADALKSWDLYLLEVF